MYIYIGVIKQQTHNSDTMYNNLIAIYPSKSYIACGHRLQKQTGHSPNSHDLKHYCVCASCSLWQTSPIPITFLNKHYMPGTRTSKVGRENKRLYTHPVTFLSIERLKNIYKSSKLHHIKWNYVNTTISNQVLVSCLVSSRYPTVLSASLLRYAYWKDYTRT